MAIRGGRGISAASSAAVPPDWTARQLPVTVSHHTLGGNMAKSGAEPTKTGAEIKLPTEHDLEVEYLMRASGRSRVQVLNALKVRGPSRDDVLRALAR